MSNKQLAYGQQPSGHVPWYLLVMHAHAEFVVPAEDWLDKTRLPA